MRGQLKGDMTLHVSASGDPTLASQTPLFQHHLIENTNKRLQYNHIETIYMYIEKENSCIWLFSSTM